jgi:hypothetical protein
MGRRLILKGRMIPFRELQSPRSGHTMILGGKKAVLAIGLY